MRDAGRRVARDVDPRARRRRRAALSARRRRGVRGRAPAAARRSDACARSSASAGSGARGSSRGTAPRTRSTTRSRRRCRDRVRPRASQLGRGRGVRRRASRAGSPSAGTTSCSSTPTIRCSRRSTALGVRTLRFDLDCAGADAAARRDAAARCDRDVVHVTEVFPQALVAARLAATEAPASSRTTRPSCPGATTSPAGRGAASAGPMRPEVIYTSETDRARRRAHRPADARRLARHRPRPVRARPRRARRAGSSATSRGSPSRRATATLVEAAAIVLERHPDVRFVVAGDGELRSELEALAAPLGDRFEFLGARDDVPDLLASFEVFAFPSRFEGLCVVGDRGAGSRRARSSRRRSAGSARPWSRARPAGSFRPATRGARGADLLGARPPDRGTAGRRRGAAPRARAVLDRAGWSSGRSRSTASTRDPVEPVRRRSRRARGTSSGASSVRRSTA